MVSSPRYLDTTDDDAWRDLLCSRKCMRSAVLLIDEDPYCMECAEEQLEYDIAIAHEPKLRSVLPPPSLRD